MRADEGREHPCVQQRPDHPGQADQAHQRALDAPLRIGADVAGDDRLRRRPGHRPQRADRHAEQEQRAAAGDAVDGETDHAAAQAEQQRAALAEAPHHPRHQQGVDHDAAHADQGQHPADLFRAPAEAVIGEQHEDARVDVVRQVGQEDHRGQREHLRVALQQAQRPEWVGVRPVHPRGASLRRQRFGQHPQAVEEVEQGQPGGEPERRAQVQAAEPAAQQRTDHETNAERGADDAVGLGALVGRGDVGDVGVGRGEAGRKHAGDHACQQQHRQALRQRHHHEVHAQPQARGQDHRAPAVAVGQCALQRRADELQGGEQEAEPADPAGRGSEVPAGEAAHQRGQHRDDDAEGQHVDQQGDEDEGDRGAA
ncbi:hypothetical protein NB705_003566 [Xanthomonas sacchari]|nr:hypothetical protein [Xanthomonas sacchari]MCW0466493.1 hypothetical protein [Xanthomonas sacchari]